LRLINGGKGNEGKVYLTKGKEDTSPRYVGLWVELATTDVEWTLSCDGWTEASFSCCLLRRGVWRLPIRRTSKTGGFKWTVHPNNGLASLREPDEDLPLAWCDFGLIPSAKTGQCVLRSVINYTFTHTHTHTHTHTRIPFISAYFVTEYLCFLLVNLNLCFRWYMWFQYVFCSFLSLFSLFFISLAGLSTLETACVDDQIECQPHCSIVL